MTAAGDREVTPAPSKHLPAEIKADSLAGDLHAECPCGWIGVQVKLLSSALIDHAAHAERAAALAAAEARGVERGRTEAAEAIAAHRDKFWPKDDRLDSARARVRRHLNIAIQVAGPPITLEDAAKALRAHLDQDADSARHGTPHTAPPRVWVLPSIPEDVEAVRDRTGIVWRRKGPMDGGWFSPGAGAWWFAEILRRFGPLTEVPDA